MTVFATRLQGSFPNDRGRREPQREIQAGVNRLFSSALKPKASRWEDFRRLKIFRPECQNLRCRIFLEDRKERDRIEAELVPLPVFC